MLHPSALSHATPFGHVTVSTSPVWLAHLDMTTEEVLAYNLSNPFAGEIVPPGPLDVTISAEGRILDYTGPATPSDGAYRALVDAVRLAVAYAGLPLPYAGGGEKEEESGAGRAVRIEVTCDVYAENPRKESTPYTSLFVPLGNRYFRGDDDVTEDAPKDAALSFPVYGYVHSAARVALSPFGCPWDSGRVGTLYLTTEQAARARREGFTDLDALARAEFAGWANYVHGDIWSVGALDCDGDVVDSVCGLSYNDPDAAVAAFVEMFPEYTPLASGYDVV